MSIAEELVALAARYNVQEFYVFGSRADEIARRVRGQPATVQHPTSDIDIGVRPAPGHRLTARDRVRLTIALEDLFDVSRVDLVVLPEASPFLALDVIRGELLYCADPDAQAEYELYVLRRAGDLAPYERERRRHILSRGLP